MMRHILTILLFLFLSFPASVALGQDGVPDTPYQDRQYTFTGAWMPDENPALIGPQNFKTLKNLRYTDTAIEGVSGYSKINTTALPNTMIRNGFQLRTTRSTPSYVLTHAYDSAGENGTIFVNTGDIPDQSNFDSEPIHSDSADAGLPIFSSGPGGAVMYTNGKDTKVWNGKEMFVSGFFGVDSDDGDNPHDYTDAVNNDLTTAGNFAVVSNATQQAFIVMSVRPLQGLNATIGTANTDPSTITGAFWNGTDFAPLTVTDGTSVSGVTLAQAGRVEFSSTVGTAKPKHYQGLFLYAYLFNATSASADTSITYMTVDAPWQDVLDVWDEVHRTAIAVQVTRGTKLGDFTSEANLESFDVAPVAVEVGALDTSDNIVVLFELERMSAIQFDMIGNSTNEVVSAPTVNYWDGDGWVPVLALSDGTASGGKTLAESGLMSWFPPDASDESEREIFGKSGFAYQIKFSAKLTGAGSFAQEAVKIDLISGIPAPLTVPKFSVTAMYKDMVFLLNDSSSKDGNKAWFSFPNTPDIWNGALTSDGGAQALYFGGSEPIVAATQIYNRYGSNLINTFVVLKDTEIYLLSGDGPENFKIDPISQSVGCAAPLTLATAAVGFQLAKDVTRNVALWLSASGPVLFDGGVLKHLEGIDSFFDPTSSVHVNFSAIENSRGWYDPVYKEYNLLIPTGTSTMNDTWLSYDLIRQKWFDRNTGDADMPQVGFVVSDSSGVQYVYGGIDSGHVMRLDNGNSWDSGGIQQVVETGDFSPSENLWRKTQIRYIQIAAKRIAEDHILSVKHIGDTKDAGTNVVHFDTDDTIWKDANDFAWVDAADASISLSLSSSLATLVEDVQPMNELARFHRFQFEVETKDTAKGFQPVAWGLQFQDVRDIR